MWSSDVKHQYWVLLLVFEVKIDKSFEFFELELILASVLKKNNKLQAFINNLLSVMLDLFPCYQYDFDISSTRSCQNYNLDKILAIVLVKWITNLRFN